MNTTIQRTLAAAAAVAATSALALAAPASASAAAASASAAPTTEVAQKRPTSVTTRADIDGDGRRDTTTMRLTSVDGETHRYTIETRTARGTRASVPLLVGADDADLEMIWVGAAHLDGKRGAEILVNACQSCDSTQLKVVTWSKGRLAFQAAPGMKGDNGYFWMVGARPYQVSGYTFSTRRGVRYVVHHDLQPSKRGTYRGTHTTYRWAKNTWVKTSTKSSGRVSDSVARQYDQLSGVSYS